MKKISVFQVYFLLSVLVSFMPFFDNVEWLWWVVKINFMVAMSVAAFKVK